MSRSAQRAATRELLLAHAREAFAARGYADVSVPEVVAAAGLTKGAVYHQFAGKADLFVAVLEQVQQGVGDAVAAAADTAPADDPWAGLLAGCRAFLVESTAAEVSRIMLVDGPAVLGWQRWRALDDAASASHLAAAVEDLVARGVLAPRPVEPVVRLLSGAMNEAALWLARPGAAATDLDDVLAALTTMLDALRASPRTTVDA